MLSRKPKLVYAGVSGHHFIQQTDNGKCASSVSLRPQNTKLLLLLVPKWPFHSWKDHWPYWTYRMTGSHFQMWHLPKGLAGVILLLLSIDLKCCPQSLTSVTLQCSDLQHRPTCLLMSCLCNCYRSNFLKIISSSFTLPVLCLLCYLLACSGKP